jgi:hypothetical protein
MTIGEVSASGKKPEVFVVDTAISLNGLGEEDVVDLVGTKIRIEIRHGKKLIPGGVRLSFVFLYISGRMVHPGPLPFPGYGSLYHRF